MIRRALLALALLSALAPTGADARSVAMEKRAEVAVQISPRERFVVFVHLRTVNPQNAEEADLKQQARDALKLDEIRKRVDAAPTSKPVDLVDFSSKRAPISMSKSDIDAVVKLLSKPMQGALDEILTPLRQELEEVAKGRSPYGP